MIKVMIHLNKFKGKEIRHYLLMKLKKELIILKHL